jgi:hypothetical protein
MSPTDMGRLGANSSKSLSKPNFGLGNELGDTTPRFLKANGKEDLE